MKIEELLNQAFDLTGRSEKKLLDLEVLLAFCIGESREYLFAHKEEEIDAFTGDLFMNFVKRLMKGEPLAYMLGEKEFYGLKFFVDERVLVPRPETEMLIEKAIEFIEGSNQKRFRILDMGTGSGCIAISLVKYFEGREDIAVEMEAFDVSEAALEVARVNAGFHAVDDVINFLQNDLFTDLEAGLSYDIILANLPYIGEKKNNFVESGVKKYEPKAALLGGDDGLSLYKKMFQQINDMNVDFKLFLGEYDDSQTDDLKLLLNNYFEQQSCRIHQDLAGLDRMFSIKKS